MITITQDLANKIYDVLENHLGETDHSYRSYFVERFSRDECKEFRLGGCVKDALAPGLKIRNNSNGIYIDYYQEHKSTKIDNKVKLINDDLRKFSLVSA